MAITLGVTEINFKLGAQAPDKIYLGANQVWVNPANNGPAVAILLRFDGDFSDSSPAGLTTSVVTYGEDPAPVIDTTIVKFGSGSGQFFDHGYIDAGSPSVLHFAVDDFTVEAWLRVDTFTNYPAFFGPDSADSNSFFAVFGPEYIWVGHYGAGWVLGDVIHGMSVDTWHHIAITRHSGTLRIFRDGILLASDADNNSYPLPTVSGLGGAPGAGNSLIGRLDDVRVVKNFAVYRNDFIPPSSILSAAAEVAPLAPSGTFLFSDCVDGNLVGTYADGTGGRYTQTISEGSC